MTDMDLAHTSQSMVAIVISGFSEYLVRNFVTNFVVKPISLPLPRAHLPPSLPVFTHPNTVIVQVVLVANLDSPFSFTTTSEDQGVLSKLVISLPIAWESTFLRTVSPASGELPSGSKPTCLAHLRPFPASPSLHAPATLDGTALGNITDFHPLCL